LRLVVRRIVRLYLYVINAIPFDELLDRHRSSVETLDGVLEAVEYCVRRPRAIEPVEIIPLEGLDER
jgi:hypothetical protein